MPPLMILDAAPVASHTNSACHFWKLPLELRFAIYDLVYGRDNTITPRGFLGSVRSRCGRSKDFLDEVDVRKVLSALLQLFVCTLAD